MYKFNKMFVMFCLGFASGLPYMIIISTSTAWLRDAGVELAYIGFFAWVTFMYAFKFLWAPFVDRFSIPILKQYGHRKSWIVLMQVIIFTNLIILSNTDPKSDLIFFSLIAFLIALAGSIQDIAIDAFRIEYANINEQGSLAATYQFGWRLAIIVATSFALIFADTNGWSLTYKIMAATMIIGLLGLIVSKEEKNFQLGKLSFTQSIRDPFVDFLSRFGFFASAVLLMIIATYRLTDIVMGPMATPFYIDMGFTLTEIGAVVKIVALLASIFGISMGALLLKKIGIYRSLMLGAFLVMLTNVCFSYVAISEKSITSLSMIVAMDSIAAGIVGTVNIAFLTSLVSKKYTGFQYALLTGFMTGPGFVLKGLSGLWVNYLQGIYGDDFGWMGFYVTTSLLTMPVILFLYFNRHFLIKHENSI
ncbi:MFS transporter [Gammaproteobacteria bacterium]|nr:MFS transporter [Gammaproteobacteria bacterium]MDC3180453.1 MFS transporter [bacterium]MDA8998215.1 MFS transporter [Gammaproteobacteria bacterium]MDA9220537.1 MFS transporter [Gammaproteobacteria bacterium]MDA9321123.1 MFS transporter [Gammaproteobacteria bacterium]|tara:strand:- start:584 stop:1840 length:1257 start_codon:yes stop_codon:yes gene_type:complete